MKSQRPLKAVTLAAFALALIAGPASSDNTPAKKLIRLGAVSNFSQGWSEQSYRSVFNLPVHRLREGIRWAEIERTRGQYRFDSPKTAWPDKFKSAGVKISLIVGGANPLYDNGTTPHTPEALAAFGRFVAAVVSRFPQVDTIEVGNEFNSGNFVSGQVKSEGLASRGKYHLALVRAAAEAARKVRPEIMVLGGAAHSMPAGYLWPLLSQPEELEIGGLAVHPYTTPIEQLPAQIRFLQRNTVAARLPLYITEYGTEDASLAADHLVRGFATLATLGAAEFDWYPLNERGDGLIPLARRDGSITNAGKAFQFVQSRLLGEPPKDASPDAFTIIQKFGPRTMVLWGAKRTVTLGDKTIAAFDATGAKLSPTGLGLKENRALILIGQSPLEIGQNIHLGCSSLVADSLYQFDYPPVPRSKGDFSRFVPTVRVGERELPFETMPGQQRPGVPWVPYLGRPELVGLQLMADQMLPAVGAKGGAIIYRYTAQHNADMNLHATFSVSQSSVDGIEVTVRAGGKTVFSKSGKEPIAADIPLSLRSGESIAVVIGPRENARGDKTDYRIQMFERERCSPGSGEPIKSLK